jgi:large subunit ribosomal protein L31
MKKETHPTYYPAAKVSCACGNNFTVGSTKEKIEVEVCANCHPFFTGNEKVMDTAGRVEKFKARANKAVPVKKKKIAKKKGDQDAIVKKIKTGVE